MNLLSKSKVPATVEWIREIGPSVFELRFRVPEIADPARPGQFIHLRLAKGLDPLLRRPLSIGWTENGCLDLLFRVVGRGTQRLAEGVVGETFDALGPLGNPFAPHPGRPALMVAGGMGVAMFPLLARQLIEAGCQELHLVYGARTAAELVWTQRLEEFGVRIHRATDDGTTGHAGRCTDLVADAMKSLGGTPAVYACGPEPMFRALLDVVPDDPAIPVQLCFEQRMGCGFGACLTCVIKTNEGYVRGCTEGPVLDGALFRGGTGDGKS